MCPSGSPARPTRPVRRTPAGRSGWGSSRTGRAGRRARAGRCSPPPSRRPRPRGTPPPEEPPLTATLLVEQEFGLVGVQLTVADESVLPVVDPHRPFRRTAHTASERRVSGRCSVVHILKPAGGISYLLHQRRCVVGLTASGCQGRGGGHDAQRCDQPDDDKTF